MEWIFLKAYLYFTVIVSCVNSQLDFGDGWNGGGRFGKRLSAHGYGSSGQGQGSGQQAFGGGAQQGGQFGGGSQQGGQSFGGGAQQGGQFGGGAQQGGLFGGGAQQGGGQFGGGAQQGGQFGGGAQQGGQFGGGAQQGGQQTFGGGGRQGGQQSNQLGFGGAGQMQGPGQQKARPQLVPQSVCVLKADPGYCNLIIGRWYYDFRYHRCLPFLYTGCGGNTNNFISPKACDATTRTCHLSPTSYMPPSPRSHDPITQSRLFGAH